MKTKLQELADILLPDVPSRLVVKETIERLLAEEKAGVAPCIEETSNGWRIWRNVVKGD